MTLKNRQPEDEKTGVPRPSSVLTLYRPSRNNPYIHSLYIQDNGRISFSQNVAFSLSGRKTMLLARFEYRSSTTIFLGLRQMVYTRIPSTQSRVVPTSCLDSKFFSFLFTTSSHPISRATNWEAQLCQVKASSIPINQRTRT